MNMRRLSLALGVCLVAAGCTVVSSSDENTDNDAGAGGAGGTAGTTNAGGSGGTAGAAGNGGTAGGAGQTTLPPECNNVPLEGRCVDSQTLERCDNSPAEKKPPVVVKATCKGGMVCRQTAEGASCELEGECAPGAQECEGKNATRTCKSGKWEIEPCGAGVCMSSPGQGASCVQNAGGQTYPIKGVLKYERAPIKADKSGYDYAAPVIDPAYAVVVTAYDGEEFLGSVYTDSDGVFTLEASKAPTATTMLYFFPMYFNEDGTIQVAVAHPSTYTYSNLESKEYWWWGAETKGASDVGTIVIKQSEGSGALNVYLMLAYGTDQAYQNAPSVKPFNVLGLWESGQRFDCGNGTCYVPKGWGATVKYDGGEDLYQGAVLIAGTEESPHQWSNSVILHEYGHYMMDSYSRSPREAGAHNTVSLEKPGMAWSEGWASFYGQMTLADPIYFDQQEGTAWWFDVSKPSSSVPMPDPNGPIDQEMAELADAAMIWHLWDPGNTKSEEESWDQAAISDALLWKAFTSTRMLDQNRGYTKVDLVDFFDSLRCEGLSEQQLASVTQHFGFPYDNAQLCP